MRTSKQYANLCAVSVVPHTQYTLRSVHGNHNKWKDTEGKEDNNNKDKQIGSLVTQTQYSELPTGYRPGKRRQRKR